LRYTFVCARPGKQANRQKIAKTSDFFMSEFRVGQSPCVCGVPSGLQKPLCPFSG
jgi:hypothetical protein